MNKIIVVMVFALIAGCASLDSGMVTSRFNESGQCYVGIARYNAKVDRIQRDYARVNYEDYKSLRLGDCIIVTKNGVKKTNSEEERQRITHGIE